MTETDTNTIKEKLNVIAATLNAIQSGGDPSYLRELQTLLRKDMACVLGQFDRNPGLDAATIDLYAAAAAIVTDAAASSQPLVRKHRLLMAAKARFDERISSARPNQSKPSATWRQKELFLAA